LVQTIVDGLHGFGWLSLIPEARIPSILLFGDLD